MRERELLEAKNILYKADRLSLIIIQEYLSARQLNYEFTCYLNEVMEKMSEEPKPGVSKKRVMEESSSSREEIEEIDPSCITDELLQKYASEMLSEIPMTVSEELLFRRNGAERV